jgi:hypothetical protein
LQQRGGVRLRVLAIGCGRGVGGFVGHSNRFLGWWREWSALRGPDAK